METFLFMAILTMLVIAVISFIVLKKKDGNFQSSSF